MTETQAIYGDPKPKTHRSKKYLAFRRTHGVCRICGKPSEPHHIRKQYWGAGTGQKPHDYVTVDRCREHHDPKYDGVFECEIINNLILYLAAKSKEPELIEKLMECCIEEKL